MLKLLILFLLGVILPCGLATAMEGSGQLTLPEAISRLRQGTPVYSSAGRPDWFSEMRYPESRTDPAWIENIQNGKAVSGRKTLADERTGGITMEEKP